jgi:hypothetical protein
MNREVYSKQSRQLSATESSLLGQFAKPLTTKATKVHEGNALDQKPSRVCILKMIHYRKLAGGGVVRVVRESKCIENAHE